MAQYMTRVELHDGEEKDYVILHAAMESEGFVRTITSKENITYHLPDAEYYRVTDLTLEQVLESGKKAATKTKKKFGIITVEFTKSRWNGLKPMEKKPGAKA